MRDAHACGPGGERGLTAGEVALVWSVFGSQLDPSRVRIRRRRWFPLQPRHITMAPCGHIHFHPRSPVYRDDFGRESRLLQGFFIHEMTHVWQVQRRGRFYLLLRRHPFCRYDYQLRTGWKLADYGLEQQAELVRHAFMISQGERVASAADQAAIVGMVRAAMAPPDSSRIR